MLLNASACCSRNSTQNATRSITQMSVVSRGICCVENGFANGHARCQSASSASITALDLSLYPSGLSPATEAAVAGKALICASRISTCAAIWSLAMPIFLRGCRKAFFSASGLAGFSSAAAPTASKLRCLLLAGCAKPDLIAATSRCDHSLKPSAVNVAIAWSGYCPSAILRSHTIIAAGTSRSW